MAPELFDSIGTALWAGLAIGAGVLLHHQVGALLDALSAGGGWAFLILLGLLALYVAWRWIERQRLRQFVCASHIDVAELRQRLLDGRAPLIVDVRSRAAQGTDPRQTPGAVLAALDEVSARLASEPLDREIVLYCDCPNDASAAQATRLLQRAGYTRVRPLPGGLAAWLAAAD